MLVPNQFVKVHWCPANKKHYESKGYTFTKYRDELTVRAEDLMQTSTIEVEVICDYCGKKYKTKYKLYLKGLEINNKNACSKCNIEKGKETNKKKYGVDNVFASKEIQSKIKETVYAKYGVEYASQSKTVKEKTVETNLQRYGVPYVIRSDEIQKRVKETVQNKYGVNNVFQNKDIKDKIAETILSKYGYTNVSQSPEIIEKVKQTNLSRRGVTCSFQDPEVIAKCRKTLYANNSVPTSKAEHKMCEYLKELYGNSHCIPSYPFNRITFDCFVTIDGVNIDVEYDGWYWHKNNQEKDKRRNYFVTKKGIKVLRFRANKEIPTKEQLKNNIEELVKSSEMLKIVELDI